MGDSETDPAGWAAMLPRLRLAVPFLVTEGEPAEEEAGWRDDLRLFSFTWAAGFVFFLIFFG